MSVGRGHTERDEALASTGTGHVHLGNLGLRHPAQARKQFQMFTSGQ